MEQTNQQTDQPPMTKREQRQQKRQEETQERWREIRRRKIKKVAIFLVPSLIVVAGLTFAIVKYSAAPPSAAIGQNGTPKIEVNPKEYDAGLVSMAAGLVKKTYEIKNAGTSDLEIDDIRTSCHCTTATLQVGQTKSGEFGMDGTKFWSQKIPAGQTGYLEVIFNPAFHGPQDTGQAVRAVYLSTNDPQNRQAEIRLIANVTL